MKAFLRRIVALIKKEFITLWYDPKSRAIIVMLSIIDMNQPILNDLPETLRDFINQNQYDNIQYFTAYCTPVQSQCNYFTHTWSMDKMIADRNTSVSTGMFEARNLQPINNEVGINALVPQNMSFHDNVYMSGNVARFKIADPTKLADA